MVEKLASGRGAAVAGNRSRNARNRRTFLFRSGSPIDATGRGPSRRIEYGDSPRSTRRIRLFSSDLEMLSDCAARPLELGRIAQGVVRTSVESCDGGSERRRSKFDETRENLLFGRRSRPPSRRLLISVLPSHISVHFPSFFYAVDPLDLRRGKGDTLRASSLSLNTPTPGGIQFYSADCFLLYRRLLR